MPVTKEDIFYAERILEDDNVPTRDGIHAAVALRNKTHMVVSLDRDFDRIKDVRRIEPK
jgi:predicted nucleic acid-binding protein